MRCLSSIVVLVALAGGAAAQETPSAEPLPQGSPPASGPGTRAHSEALDRLQSLPKPARQQDLSTFELASAHRERAASMEEKTNGLWQSWLVSICEGCGPESRPFTDWSGDAYARKLRARHEPAPAEKPRYTYYRPAGGVPDRHTSLASNLSNENIDQIRRDPNH